MFGYPVVAWASFVGWAGVGPGAIGRRGWTGTVRRKDAGVGAAGVPVAAGQAPHLSAFAAIPAGAGAYRPGVAQTPGRCRLQVSSGLGRGGHRVSRGFASGGTEARM